MSTVSDLQPRQIWAYPTPTTTALPRHCTPFKLSAGGSIDIGNGTVFTLTQEATFQPTCPESQGLNTTPPAADTPYFHNEDPFYASTSPQMYALAAVTVVSYILVIILFITPRTFFVGGSSGGGGFLGQRGMISGASGSTSVIGVGSRPWLQKVAALTVAISMTIATVDTFRAAQQQYNDDYSDATALSNEVIEGLEIRVVRVISETCLWLAQAQTLIRLFPRHKEKVIIKWAGFVLIGLDTIFSILNKFVSKTNRSAPRKFQDAVPALSYLFTFCLSLIYAAWIVYYSLSKRRYAFVHQNMRNICLVAFLSYVAVMIPVVFFILDISIYNVAGWGNYVRWVGAAAASVVVWEWVERIEALEREERKDGILGREIFDGDEMLEVTPSLAAVTWSNSYRRFHGGGKGNETAASGSREAKRKTSKHVRSRNQLNPDPRSKSTGSTADPSMAGAVDPNPPFSISTPTMISGPGGDTLRIADSTTTNEPTQNSQQLSSSASTPVINKPSQNKRTKASTMPPSKYSVLWNTLQRLPIPFLNRRMSPPLEVKEAVRAGHADISSGSLQETDERALDDRPTIFEKIRLKRAAPSQKPQLPVTVIPAPARNNTPWDEVRLQIPQVSISRPESINTGDRHSTSRTSTPALSRLSQRYSPVPLPDHRSSRRPSLGIPGPEDAREPHDLQSEARDVLDIRGRGSQLTVAGWDKPSSKSARNEPEVSALADSHVAETSTAISPDPSDGIDPGTVSDSTKLASEPLDKITTSDFTNPR
ncbi:MAG: hypothetical protein Q9190_004966 [Brigantiaea leucoxantha]